jgi:hypothetical protein
MQQNDYPAITRVKQSEKRRFGILTTRNGQIWRLILRRGRCSLGLWSYLRRQGYINAG